MNALLDEADVLPTSGSRGCTAAVVELRYNHDFVEDPATDAASVFAYRGCIEFISLKDWLDDLEILLDDCCAGGTATIVTKVPDDGEAKVAWDKINQVYGHGTMESFKAKPKALALEQISQDERVLDLLKEADGRNNTIVVEEGEVDATKAKLLKQPYSSLTSKLRREKKKWANNFRTKINDFVYRKGNGKEPQTWPLIRKVILYGPWQVLKSGAVLVDLPGKCVKYIIIQFVDDCLYLVH